MDDNKINLEIENSMNRLREKIEILEGENNAS